MFILGFSSLLQRHLEGLMNEMCGACSFQCTAGSSRLASAEGSHILFPDQAWQRDTLN